MKYIAIHSVPRSGSTWLGNIFNSHPDIAFKFQPLFSYAFKGFLTEDSSSSEINQFFNEIAVSRDSFLNQEDGISRGMIPKFEKRLEPKFCCYKEVRYHNILPNMLEKSPDVKCVLLIRNPLAVIYSWWKAPKEFREDEKWDILEEWKNAPKKNLNKREEFHGYTKWKEVTLLFLILQRKYPEQVTVLNYNDLLSQPFQVVEKTFKFCGIDMATSTKSFIEKSQNIHHDDAYSVFKKRKKDDAWDGQLQQEIIDYVTKDLKDTPLEQYLYDSLS
ncbi:sulfotransferase domain-containing protein [Winogradskyella maritima]|uniref:Sulfotransferase domain-containing protein n=1 Tax=Winogradskyella maritima TaxID=1517766 RepID=A0ABV8AKT5_9FLAO|nr:sulfotransferase domain-containing protein [Winogradskyella maritima]